MYMKICKLLPLVKTQVKAIAIAQEVKIEDLDDKLTGGNLSAPQWNDTRTEAQNVVLGTGQVLSGGDSNQLGKGIADYVANGSFYTDSGTANAKVLTQIGLKQAPTAYTDGLVATFVVGTTSTAATTVNVATLGVKNVTGTIGGEMVTGATVSIRYSTATGEFSIFDITATSFENLLVNPHFNVALEGSTFTSATTPANNDDTYVLDTWILLSDGNDIVDVSQETTVVPTGIYSGIKLDVETANTKFGILQVIEAKDCRDIIGGKASFSFQARRTGTSVDNLRAAIISWDSTEDVVTSDVVSAWNGAGTDPTLVANWTYENTPINLGLSTPFQTFEIKGVDIDTASTKNVAVFIWVDDVDASIGDFVYISDCKLQQGSELTSITTRRIEQEIALVQRVFCKSYDATVDPGSITDNGAIIEPDNRNIVGTSYGTRFPVEMRDTPTVTIYAPTSGNSGNSTNAGDKVSVASGVGTGGIMSATITAGSVSALLK